MTGLPSLPVHSTPTETPTETQGGSGGNDSGGIIRLIVRDVVTADWRLIAANVVLGSLLSVVIYRFRSLPLSTDRRVLVSGIFGSILAGGYGLAVLFGPIVPLDPSRYLVYMIPTLFLAIGYVVDDLEIPFGAKRVFSGLVLAMIVTQMVIISPFVMYSDPIETSTGEDHYSASQLAGSDWAGTYAGRMIVAWEKGLWVANDIFRWKYGSQGDSCSLLHVWRQDAPYQYLRTDDSVVYDNGPMRLYYCRG